MAAALCENGFAGIFPCENYDLISTINLTEFGAAKGNDIWGWTAPSGKEFVLMGLDNGTGFVDISTPSEPVYLGKLPTATVSSNWRDVKVYQNYAFIVSEAEGHGMQVFDLTRLESASGVQTFTADATYNEFGNAHNIVINTNSGYAYAVGTETFDGGPHFINIQNPLQPTAAGGYSMGSYSHDAQVVIYQGPDLDHQGKEILIGSNTDEIVIVDISDKSNPQEISTISYANVGYTHQGWFTEDQRFFLLGDELDEVNFGFNSKTLIFDFTDLDNPQLHFEYLGPNASIDHNGYVKGDLFYLANYTSGLRVLDLSAIEDQQLTEVGSFDTFPDHNDPVFRGVWSVYPYFQSGNIILSDITGGLFIVKEKI
ncbi:MAG: choice-of-anchor B family protein [Flavobacteriaceae bacterium]|nr:choice-of-anchor B family protein [Flavobacteriaceae bacterium]